MIETTSFTESVAREREIWPNDPHNDTKRDGEREREREMFISNGKRDMTAPTLRTDAEGRNAFVHAPSVACYARSGTIMTGDRRIGNRHCRSGVRGAGATGNGAN